MKKDIKKFLTKSEIKNGFPQFDRVIAARNIKFLELEIERVIEQLDMWQRDTLTGEWSTHQVIPMRSLANKLRRILNKKERNYETKR